MREEILNKYKNEDKLFAATIIDKINKYQKTKKEIYTNYLTPTEYNIAISILNKYKTPYTTYDHFELLERKLISISNEPNFDYIKTIKIINKSPKTLEHKDYMGALYNCGIKENNIGDIFITDDHCICFTTNTILDYILYNIQTVGNNNVLIEEINKEEVNITNNLEDISFTSSSLRIDAIIAKHFKMSRNQANELIKKKNLFINTKNTFNNSYILKENDIIALRRYGKFKYLNSTPTRKEKLLVNIKAYK